VAADANLAVTATVQVVYEAEPRTNATA